MKRDAVIKSMFHRRLLLVMTLIVLTVGVLQVRLYQLTVLESQALLAEAERVLVTTELLPTWRGRILDRNGLILAHDAASFDLSVHYSLISGTWAREMAAREARQEAGEAWAEMDAAARTARIDEAQRTFDRQLDQLWREIALTAGRDLGEIVAIRDGIRDETERMAQYLWQQWKEEWERRFESNVSIETVKRPIREQTVAHPIISGIDAGRSAEFARMAETGPRTTDGNPALVLAPSGTREYPWLTTTVVLDRSTLPGSLRSDEPIAIEVGNVGAHLLGSMRMRIFKEDIDRLPLRNPDRTINRLDGYAEGDSVGARGIEAMCEMILRGSRGVIIKHLDDGSEERTEPVPGDDVQLTLDVRLQARVQAILDPAFGLTRVQPFHVNENGLPVGTPLRASAAIVEVATGDVVALVTTPPDAEMVENVQTPEQGDLIPMWINRASDVPYPPGSIVKPLTLAWSVSRNRWSSDRVVTCNGHYYPDDPEHFRCWIYRPGFGFAAHGPLEAIPAVARSCNIYFYTIGNTLGGEGLEACYRDWGLVPETPLTLAGGTFGGLLKGAAAIERNEALMMGIGQGPVAWTPLHAATAYATLARGGYYIEPSIFGDVAPREEPRRRRDLGLYDQAISLALSGLDEVVNNSSYGGARQIDVNPPSGQFEPIFNQPGIEVWGKTGTAQQTPWPTRLQQFNADGSPVLDGRGNPVFVEREAAIGTHSWFTGLAVPQEGARAGTPTHAIAVVVEWGGSGSRCAAPIANQIVSALRAEGHL